MPGRAPATGAPTLLFLMIKFAVLFELVTPARMPLPSIPLMVLPMIDAEMVPVCPGLSWLSTDMPLELAMLSLASMKLLWTM